MKAAQLRTAARGGHTTSTPHHGSSFFSRSLAFTSRPRTARCRCQISAETTTTAQAAAPQTPSATSEGLIFSRGSADAWDAAAVGNPVVRCYMGDNEQRWYMWYSGSSDPLPGLQGVAAAAGSIGVAVSSDGINWLRGDCLVEGHRSAAEQLRDVGVVLGPNSDNWWTLDTAHLSVSDVQVLSNSSVSSGVGVYWMFYSGGDFEPVAAPEGLPGVTAAAAAAGGDAAAAAAAGGVEGLRMRPGLAMSQDGRNWARIEAEHHTHALFDVGAPGEWDATFIGHPQVLAAGPRDMRMFYHSYDVSAQKFKVGMASSRDGFTWKKEGVVFEGGSKGGQRGAFDAGGAAACHVVRDPDSRQFLMFYEAVAADGSRSIGLATSQDGKSNWSCCAEPLLAPSQQEGAWDAGGVGAPCAVPMSGGRWRLYYAGRAQQLGPWEGIGVALGGPAEGADAAAAPGQLLSFKRRTGKKAAVEAE